MKTKCPLHNDSSPSFSINLNTGEWKCWSQCGGNSDLAYLIAKLTEVSPDQARRTLYLKVASDPRALSDILEPKTDFPRKQEPIFYIRNQIPKYFINRGFTLDTAKRWQIGYEPELKGVAIPVKEDGRLVGLVTRTLSGLPTKYVTSAGFIKSHYLFGIDHVDPSSTWTFVVEGPLNAIWLNQYGYPAVAVMGVEISKEQQLKLSRRFSDLILAFDNDLDKIASNGVKIKSPGKIATKKAIEQLKGFNISILPIPAGKDVQEMTKEEIDKAYSNKIPSWQWLANVL